MVVRLHALTVLASEPEVLASFWGDLLGWERSGLDLLPDADAPMRLSFEAADLPRARLNQVHFHLTSYGTSQEANVARVLALGGSHLDVGQLPEEDHVVLADPEGNEFCVIEESNSWLAGMGFLGELAADGTRDVGVFWAAALDWPLVHDEDGETAIQPPEGGMRIAWVGRPSTSAPPGTGCTSSWSPTTPMPRSSGWCPSAPPSWRGATTSRWPIRTGTSSTCAEQNCGGATAVSGRVRRPAAVLQRATRPAGCELSAGLSRP